ncbi:hypothetical protein, partial [Shewanella sp. AC91-MNA-CIBAN-0169]|uniref:hypothetical protein n=1 Tax=Shewanella sp. AC91-MNA-CIBAN-0169 TaxID=3140466 RepID=UPI00332E8089
MQTHDLIDNYTHSKFTKITRNLWIVLILSISILSGSYAVLTWGDTAAQLLIATDKHFWYLSRASGVMAYTLFWVA